MSIFRSHYYDDVECRIYIPNKNADTFIRRGYYGGHADLYIPSDEDLDLLDINSLYPYVMALFDMPGGEPEFHSNLGIDSGLELKDMFGYIEAYVITPPNMKRPFLPYRSKKHKTLLFPTGMFGGVYRSEEFKFAEKLGYNVTPERGVLFKRMKTPFKDFVNDLYQKRLEAKSKEDKAMSYIHKITMNSLYGRFGISPESTLCKIGTLEEALRAALDKPNFMDYNRLGVNKKGVELFIYSYKESAGDNEEWNPPSFSAVQISAAITAYARMHMYPFISREDCCYTDTDSIVLKKPLPEEFLSATEIGKFKHEMKIEKGIFLAPKSYYVRDFDTQKDIIKHKGAGKAMAGKEWFQTVLEAPDRESTHFYKNKFHLNWGELFVQFKDSKITLRVSSNKRRLIRDDSGRIVGTEPINVEEPHSNKNPAALNVIKKFIAEKEALENQLTTLENSKGGHNTPQSEGNETGYPLKSPQDRNNKTAQETPKKGRVKKTAEDTPKKARVKKTAEETAKNTSELDKPGHRKKRSVIRHRTRNKS